MLEVLDYAIKCVPVARPDAAPKLVLRRQLKLIKKEIYSLSVKEQVLARPTEHRPANGCGVTLR